MCGIDGEKVQVRDIVAVTHDGERNYHRRAEADGANARGEHYALRVADMPADA